MLIPRRFTSDTSWNWNAGSVVSSAVLQRAALLTAEGFALNSAGVVVQLDIASESTAAPAARTINLIFKTSPNQCGLPSPHLPVECI
jgi:hypothetical protein